MSGRRGSRPGRTPTCAFEGEYPPMTKADVLTIINQLSKRPGSNYPIARADYTESDSRAILLWSYYKSEELQSGDIDSGLCIPNT